MADYGHAVAYTVVEEGLPVVGSDGGEVGSVKRVLHDEGADIFDGITIDTSDGERFADAAQVEGLYERAVVLTVASGEASTLPEHSPAPAVVDVSADDVAGDGPGDRTRGFVRRAWDRISGNY